MGFAASQARLLSLIARKSDLEFEGQLINQQRLYLANMVSGFFNINGKLEPESPAAKVLDARIRQLQQADKVLEMHLSRIDSQRDAITQEMQALRQQITNNIQSSFGLLGR